MNFPVSTETKDIPRAVYEQIAGECGDGKEARQRFGYVITKVGESLYVAYRPCDNEKMRKLGHDNESVVLLNAMPKDGDLFMPGDLFKIASSGISGNHDGQFVDGVWTRYPIAGINLNTPVEKDFVSMMIRMLQIASSLAVAAPVVMYEELQVMEDGTLKASVA